MSASTFFSLSDLSLLSTFIFGQAAIKVFQFPHDTFIVDGNEKLSGLVALVICVGVLPSAVIFSFTFNTNSTSAFIMWIQPILLLISVVIYSLFAFLTNAANLLKMEVTRTIVEKTIDDVNENKT